MMNEAVNSALGSTAQITQFISGAVRSGDSDNTQFSIICTTAEERIAATYAEGLAKYGLDNWTRGMPIIDTLNHVKNHINKYLSGESRTEDDLAHAAWGIIAVMHFENCCRCHVRREELDILDKQYLQDNQPRNEDKF